MKKIISGFVFSFLILAVFPLRAEGSRNSYWQYWQQRNVASSLMRKYGRSSSSSSLLLPTYGSTSTYRTNTYQKNTYQTSTSLKTLRVSANATTLKPILALDEPVKFLELGFSNSTTARSNVFQEAILVKTLEFQMVDMSGIGQNPENFELVVDGADQAFDFERTGYVTLDFNNLRLASGESKTLSFSIKAKDPETAIPHRDGSFRVKLKSVSAQTESGQKTVKTSVSGKSVSDFLTFNLTPSYSGTPTVGGGSTQIYSKTLSAGEKAYVLSLNLSAHMDDFIVEEITVSNEYGTAIDDWVRRFNLVNFSTGEILDTTRFVEGKATFNVPYNALWIDRNTQVKLGFQVELVSSIPSASNRQFKLTIEPEDLIIFGVGAGSYLPDDQKFLTLDSKEFFVAQNRGGGVFSSDFQPDFVSVGTLQPMYYFKIKNEGTREISVGRFSLSVRLSGVEFPGGISTDDFELRELHDGQPVFSPSFSTTSVNGSEVAFDALREIYVPGGTETEFVLQIALDNIQNARDENDSINVKILGDGTLQRGSLDYVRSQSSRFIWSDQSGSPHSVDSEDWFSGYLFPGLPTNNFVKYRR